MLPIGSVDETVLNSGGFIVRYHKDAAMVLDVFYWKENGRFSYASSGKAESAIFGEIIQKAKDINATDKSDEEKEKELKKEFRNLSGAVIGYYGGEQANKLTKGDPLNAPMISVNNSDKLTVKVKNTNPDNPNAVLTLVISGETSGNDRVITLTPTMADTCPYVSYDPHTQEYTVTLDDVTQPGMHFKDLLGGGDPNSEFKGGNLIPGENIKIHAEAFDNTQLTNVAKSPEQKTNSLFGSVTGDGEAQITSIRHLENLSTTVSGVGQPVDVGGGTTKSATVDKAKQSTDLDWDSFKKNTQQKDEHGNPLTGADGNPLPTKIYTLNDKTAEQGHDSFVPIDKNTKFNYDGGNHSISNLEISNETGNAGLFGTISTGDPSSRSSISNLKLVDPHVQGGGDTGALAGSATNTNISNVMVCNSDKTDPTDPNYKPNVKSTNGNAGGLVGSMNGGTITKSSSSVPVESENGNAGGLAGTVENTMINACYTGGQTKEGMYEESNPNVKGKGSVGGLVGSAESSTVISSYSTCSAGGTDSGSNVGGLIGSTSGTDTKPTTVTNSYCTGLVTGSGTKGAVVGNAGNTNFNETYYYGIINEAPAADGKGYETMKPVGNNSNANVSGITEMDKDQETFERFVSMTADPNKPFDDADPYDDSLGDKYPFNTVNQLGTSLAPAERLTINEKDFVNVHIGDWPSPETRVINTL